MKYCADTWFLLELYGENIHAKTIIHQCQEGKDWVYIPLLAYAELFKKLFQRGLSEETINLFFMKLEEMGKVQIVRPEETIAREAAKVSFTYRVPMVDSFVAATAKITNCDTLLASDADYDLLKKKKYLKVQSW